VVILKISKTKKKKTYDGAEKIDVEEKENIKIFCDYEDGLLNFLGRTLARNSAASISLMLWGL